jgi:hypothetical protein
MWNQYRKLQEMDFCDMRVKGYTPGVWGIREIEGFYKSG